MTAPDLPRIELGTRLRISRQCAGLSQQQAADGAGLQRSAVSDIERGIRRVDTLELQKLAGLYNEEVAHFVGDIPPTGQEALVQRLETVTANLFGYLERRALELAEPHIRAVQEASRLLVRRAESDLRQQKDLVAELRRHLTAMRRRAQRAEHKNGVVHPSSDECPDCTPASAPERTSSE